MSIEISCLETAYLKLLKVDESLADAFLLSSIKAKLFKDLWACRLNTKEFVPVEETVESEKEMLSSASSASLSRPEVIAQLDSLGVEYKSKHSTFYLRKKLNKALSDMQLGPVSNKIRPSKAECNNTVITKNPEKDVKQDLITSIMDEANNYDEASNYDEEEEAYNLSNMEGDSDW